MKKKHELVLSVMDKKWCYEMDKLKNNIYLLDKLLKAMESYDVRKQVS